MQLVVTLDLPGWNAEGADVQAALRRALESFAATPAGSGTVSPRDTGTLYSLAGPIGTWQAS